MESPESDPFDDPETADDELAGDESAEDYAADLEDDPARNPDDDDLEDVKGG